MTYPDNTNDENQVQGQPVENDGGTDSGNSPDDIYAPYLNKFPESLHGIAREVFREWDGNVTKRIQNIHDEYAPYKPIVDNYDAEAVQQAIMLTERLEEDPQAFYNALAGAYGLEAQQAAQAVVQEEEDTQQTPAGYDLSNDPRFAQHEQMLTSLAQVIVGERQEREQAILQQQQDELLTNTLAELEKQHGAFDERYVMTLLAQGVDPETAVKDFHNTLNQWQTQQNSPTRRAPLVMGGGGGIPAGGIPPEALTGNQTEDLVATLLRQAKENG